MNETNHNAELLNFIYQNSQMGVDTITQLLDIAADETFKKHLHAQLKEYRSIHDKAAQMLETNGFVTTSSSYTYASTCLLAWRSPRLARVIIFSA